MKAGKKIAIGCLIALLAGCLIAAALGWWLFGDFIKQAVEMSTNTSAIQQLDQTHAFTRPADGKVGEERLSAYIDICAAVKPHIDALDTFDEDHGGAEGGSFEAAKQGLGIFSDMMKSWRESLESARMSPSEFFFIMEAMEDAAHASAHQDDTVADSHRNMIRMLEQQMADPTLTGAERSDVEEKLEEYRARLEEAKSTRPDPNVALYRKYISRLQEVRLGEAGEMMLQGVRSGQAQPPR